MSVSVFLDQCFLCLDFIGNLTTIMGSDDEIANFLRRIGVQLPDNQSQCDLMLCDICMSSANQFNSSLSQFALLVQSSVDSHYNNIKSQEELIVLPVEDLQSQVDESHGWHEEHTRAWLVEPPPAVSTVVEKTSNNVHASGSQTFQCDLCPKVYKQIGGLKYHNRAAHSNVEPTIRLGKKRKLFRCNQCSKRYVFEKALQHHIADAHSNVQNVSCDQCPRSFHKKCLLTCHMRAHAEKSRDKKRGRD